MSKTFFTYLLIVLVCASESFAQIALKDQYKLAIDLFNRENYFDSITEFKRLLFFDDHKAYSYSANEIIGKCYKMGAKLSDAVYYFTIAEMNAETKDEVFNSKVQIIRINILRRTTDRALGLLDSLDKDKRFQNRKGEINYWRGWAFMLSDQWDSAAVAFGKTDSAFVLKNLADCVNTEKYSETAARILSYIIPGSGQFYTGNYVSGLLSFGWNLLWGYVTINSFVNNRIIEGLLVGDLLWLRFYNGNNQNAVKFVRGKNLQIVNKALYYLQYKYEGAKP
jgi:TM2 domain-containing membrane protein YozV